MEVIGKRFEEGEYFLPELMMAGEMLGQIAQLVKPLLAQSTSAAQAERPTVLLGTVQGDLHDIGKDIVKFMLEVNGFPVIDLGIDVPVQTFVDKVREHQPAVVALSGFLTLAFDSMRETVVAIEAAGLRDRVKIMIGGGQVDETIRKYTGADAYGLNAMAAVSLCQGWLGKAA
jgi:5-methyltetrahydrofolate--homocysteine methyltransferase